MADPRIGQLLSNRYQLIQLIGRGAMGQVYKAEDVLLGGVIVAVKFLSQTLLTRKMRDRFRSEARTCALLSTKSMHIVRVMDYGVDDQEVPYYVMEYLEGNSLSDVIGVQNLPLPRFLSLARQICAGLQCAHQGITIEGTTYPIIHRDIKPSNILVIQDPGFGELVKILDFGISKLLQSDASQTSSYMGTLAYSSPEQMEGRELDARSDIYSLGVLLYEMLTGKMPLKADTHSFGGWYKTHHFQAPEPFEAISPSAKVPKILESLVMSCLAKLPQDRPDTIEDILKALEPLEQRYNATRQISHRIGEALLRRPVVTPPRDPNGLSPDEACQLTTWPKNKPIAQIVFPHILETKRETSATLWVMLSQQEIENIQIGKLYNQFFKTFLCIQSPHPVIMWVTALYNQLQHKDGNPRWLKCFLDLKTEQGQKLTRLLIEKESYYILFFAIEDPHHCAYVMPLQTTPMQRSQLLEWMLASQTWASVGNAATSKELLKTEFEKAKPKIIAELANRDSQIKTLLP
ncbi:MULTISPECIES: serine/threonine protein kinase [Leptolyngbya]|jgi:serine/threonine protein kinase|uniref:Serine/threonine protein kinase n=1 Tax=Leptolyngbya boryana NIES-2135 TaxID=1973484 RepID=A0A1Z4JF97_LEPBY|nr:MULTISPECIES: serine/threonine-protein kinase [Leptolyngbya]BAY55429.1 serine/threonine protein kinase [Leptolyngbya boryana NIES-2135]MBD1854403.1 serine/threonine protein kinase [Leptolyngbya sp. FACHB-1624]MBD2368419.1 serine/threonine protein kinase [Leptolyngbya sp. FACHB-161]MBD2374925.1 serine/threonine protein kinase [Leptolyngbya sp. FACHB-238]MBD2399345.1 serine/threonine protein kinase [Leptolyngbya sp. FACHB-239]